MKRKGLIYTTNSSPHASPDPILSARIWSYPKICTNAVAEFPTERGSLSARMSLPWRHRHSKLFARFGFLDFPSPWWLSKVNTPMSVTPRKKGIQKTFVVQTRSPETLHAGQARTSDLWLCSAPSVALGNPILCISLWALGGKLVYSQE